MRHHKKIAAGLLASVLVLAGCTAAGAGEASSTESSSIVSSSSETTATQEETVASAATASSEATVSSGTTESVADVDWSSLPTTEVTLTDEGLTITEAGTYVLTGTSTRQVTVASDGNVRIILDGVTINSTTGAAIQVDSAELTVLELAEGSTNTISDASTRSDEEIDGAIYSADDLVITGSGTLDVTATFADGIVGKDDLMILSGTIDVTSVDDGIRGKDSLTIADGTITIDAAGDGLKASNDTDLGEGQLVITGGDITIASGDDAVKAEQQISISGGTIDIEESVEGIEAPVVVIDDGDITVNASDDGINASASAIVTDGLSVTINGGTLAVVMGSGDTDAIDSNGDLTITGGTIDITAQSPFDFDGTGTLSGGTITVNGQQVTELTNQMMGGGGQMGGGPGGR